MDQRADAQEVNMSWLSSLAEDVSKHKDRGRILSKGKALIEFPELWAVNQRWDLAARNLFIIVRTWNDHKIDGMERLEHFLTSNPKEWPIGGIWVCIWNFGLREVRRVSPVNGSWIQGMNDHLNIERIIVAQSLDFGRERIIVYRSKHKGDFDILIGQLMEERCEELKQKSLQR